MNSKDKNKQKASGIQVQDDLRLLNDMMIDLNRADDLYKPTNYWQVYEKLFLPELKKYGLHNFRRRGQSILLSFSGVDLLLRGRIEPRLKFKGSAKIAQLLEKVFIENPFYPINKFNLIIPECLTPYFYSYVEKKFQLAGLDLNRCPTSLFGNPEDIAEINGNFWSLTHLNYCSIVADASLTIKFQDEMFICELGGGMGRNIEILAALYPKATFILFDIPPQLYVANQYLSAVFGERVISYRKALSLKPENSDTFRKSIKGKIVILPALIMPEWSFIKIDLFWNCASFQEMEPDVVSNYLSIVKKMSPQYIYISALPKGNYWGKWKPGQGGTREPVLSKYYFDFLKDNYALKIEYKTDTFLTINDNTSYIFENKI